MKEDEAYKKWKNYGAKARLLTDLFQKLNLKLNVFCC